VSKIEDRTERGAREKWVEREVGQRVTCPFRQKEKTMGTFKNWNKKRRGSKELLGGGGMLSGKNDPRLFSGRLTPIEKLEKASSQLPEKEEKRTPKGKPGPKETCVESKKAKGNLTGEG